MRFTHIGFPVGEGRIGDRERIGRIGRKEREDTNREDGGREERFTKKYSSY